MEEMESRLTAPAPSTCYAPGHIVDGRSHEVLLLKACASRYAGPYQQSADACFQLTKSVIQLVSGSCAHELFAIQLGFWDLVSRQLTVPTDLQVQGAHESQQMVLTYRESTA